MSDPLPAATTISGVFSGDLVAALNVRDVDVGVVLYELTAAGKYIYGSGKDASDETIRDATVPVRPTLFGTSHLRFRCYVKRVRYLTTA